MEAIERLEARLVDLLASLGPWMAPVPTAWLVAHKTMHYLGYPPFVAYVAAAAIEVLGIVSLATWFDLWRYGRERKARHPKPPMMAAWAGFVFYPVVAILLGLVLDVYPAARPWSAVVFPLLSVEGAVLLSLRRWLVQTRGLVAEMEAERRAGRRANAQRGAQAHAQADAQVNAQFNAQRGASNVQAVGSLDRQSRLDALLALYEAQPTLRVVDAARALGVHRNTASAWRKALIEAGRLRKNGKGWEVIHEATG